MKNNLQDLIKKTKLAYKNIARLDIDNNKLVLRNITTGVLHQFVDGRMFIPISRSEVMKVHEWINES